VRSHAELVEHLCHSALDAESPADCEIAGQARNDNEKNLKILTYAAQKAEK
jgi:hypothetical protein